MIKALRKLEEAWNVEKTNFKYYKDTEHPINFNVGKIKGGDWASSVPSWCEFDCRIAIFPDWDPKEKSLEIENCIREASLNDAFLSNNPPQIEWNGFFAKGYVLEEGTEAEKVLGESHFLAYEGDMKSFISPAYLDARVFMVYGDCPCLVYGPYSENIHGFDERVSLNSVRKITKTIALFIADWCKLEKI
jgi:acetylornithine deacetylase